MQVQFKKPVTLGKSTYGKGTHDVPVEETRNNWFFDALVKDGSLIVLRDTDTDAATEEVASESTDADGAGSDPAGDYSAPANKRRGRPAK